MKLITKAIENKLKRTPLYSTENVPCEQKKGIVKFFMPCTAATWIVYEAEKQGNDWLFFGKVDLGYGYEWGYFTFNEIASLKNRYGMGIERDMYFN